MGVTKYNKRQPINLKGVTLKPIPNFPGYKAGSDGRVYSFKIRGRHDYNINPRILRPSKQSNKKYLFYTLCHGSRPTKPTMIRAHQAVCSAFHGIGKEGQEVSHLDGDAFNNVPGNLKWETRSENHKRKLLHGTHDRGCYNSRASLSFSDLNEVRLLLKKGMTHADIARKYGVSRTVITNISLGKKYRHE